MLADRNARPDTVAAKPQEDDNMTTELRDLFDDPNPGAIRLFELLRDPEVSQITINRFDRVFFSDRMGPRAVEGIFTGPAAYLEFLNELLALTDVGFTDVSTAPVSIIEGSFDPARTDLHGSIHLATKEITRGDPALTIRKQPHQIVTLDTMLNQRMMSTEMRNFLELAVRGRSNILCSGASGAGKTTMIRALSWYVDANHRVVTCEEIDELHLADRLPNCVALTTSRQMDENGRTIRETNLEDLVREALRMRADRIWVGETRGREAYALVKACNSGHDGSMTTIHADSGRQAVKQLVTYVMESGLSEEVAREQVAQAFHLVVQISKVKLGRRVITEISELEPVREGTEQRRNVLFQYNHNTEAFEQVGTPTRRLLNDWARYGVDGNGW